MNFSLFLTLCVLVSVTVGKRPYYDLKKAQQYFNRFIATYKKHYDVPSGEKLKRFKIFKDNLKIINLLNAYNKSIHGITVFCDLTLNEFQEQIECVTPRTSNCEAVEDAQLERIGIPETLDYRDSGCVTSVKNQEGCKSCWAFTAAGVLEGAYKIKKGELLNLSAQQLMDCLPSSGHCTESGNTITAAFRNLIDSEKVMLASDYPYVANNEVCQYNEMRAKVNVTDCTYFKLSDEGKLKEALVKHGPIGIALNPSTFQHYVSGVLDIETCPPNTPTHAVLLIGYGTEQSRDYWLLKNSWGTDWGEQGYFKVARGHDVCGMHNSYAAFANVD